MYCAECRPLVAEERKGRQKDVKRFKRSPVEEDQAGLNHKPRLIRDPNAPPLPPASIKVMKQDEPEEDLLTSIMRAKGQPVELRKQVLEKQASGDEGQKKRRKRGGRGRNKNRGGDLPQGAAPSAPSAPRSVAPGQRVTF
jgi:hypothetical protein